MGCGNLIIKAVSKLYDGLCWFWHLLETLKVILALVCIVVVFIYSKLWKVFKTYSLDVGDFIIY